MEKYLVVFSFSPVQGFISASRKTKDFFMSSYLLSFLTKRVLERISNLKEDVEIVYPQIKNSEICETLTANYPNRFVVKVDIEDIEDFINEIKKAFEEEIKYISQKACEDLIGETLKLLKNEECSKLNGQEIKNALEQLKKQFETYFGSYVAAKKLEGNYKDIYEETERILGARKTFRNYCGIVDRAKINGRYPDGCSVCGERLHLSIDFKSVKDVDENEKLCGVCYIKRRLYKIYLKHTIKCKEKDFENFFEHFPSTHDISLSKEYYEFLKELSQYEDGDFVKRFSRKLNQIINKGILPKSYGINLNFVKWINENNLNDFKYVPITALSTQEIENLIKSESDKDVKKELEDYLKELKTFLNTFKEKKGKDAEDIFNSPKYFSIIYSDGDNIGKILGGEGIYAEDMEKFHIDFSRKLSEYADTIVEEIERNGNIPGFAKVIYAGGDDVFVFSHREEVIRILKLTRDKYRKILEELVKEPTNSAGVVIGHAKVSLRLLHKKTHEAEHEAKNKFGRNAFVIKVISRSGEETTFGSKFYYDEIDSLEVLKAVKEIYENHEGASGLPYTLREISETLPFEGDKSKLLNVFLALFKKEYKRKELPKDCIDIFEEFLRKQEEAHRDLTLKEIVKNFAGLFYVGRFLGRRR